MTHRIARLTAVALFALAATTVAARSASVVSSTSARSSADATYAASADASVNASTPATNAGSALKLYADGSPSVRSYLRFNVALAAGSQVSGATLRVFMLNDGSPGEVLDAHGVSDHSWSEGSITSSNAPAYGATVGSSGALATGTWASIDVTPLVRAAGTVDIALTTANTRNVPF